MTRMRPCISRPVLTVGLTVLAIIVVTSSGDARAQVTCDALVVSQDACTGAQANVAVQVDGSGSSDPTGDLAYAWTSDCPGASFDDAASAGPTLTVDVSQVCSHVCSATLAVTGPGGSAECDAPIAVSCADPNVALLATLSGAGQFGYAVNAAGDVDGDTYPDVIIGAIAEDVGLLDFAGQAHVVSGQDYATELLTIAGDNDFDNLGVAVAGAGDVNGDGFSDVIVGALLDDDGAANVGSASVISGSDGATIDVFYGQNGFDHFGVAVDGAGDVNGDDYDDVIVGAQLADSIASNAGAAYVFSGSDGALLFTIDGPTANDRLGNAVAGAGDVNGDGYADVIVGAYIADNGGVSGAGLAEVYLGSNDFSGGPVLHFAVTGSHPNERTGAAVAGAGDVNGDGYADVIVSSSYPGADAGTHVDVLSGLDGAVLTSLVGNLPAASFGLFVDGLGDVDGDGFDDILVGAAATGFVGVYSGVDGTLRARICTAEVVSAASAAGDVTGDGVSEVVVGMQFAGAGGEAAVYSISAAPPNQPPVAEAGGPYEVDEGSAVALDGSASSDPDGDLLAYAWDLDGDGTFETTGATPLLSAADGPATLEVTLEVCDPSDACSSDDATVEVENVAPVVDAGADETLLSGETLYVAASFTDPSSEDTHTATIDFGTGAGPEPAAVDAVAGLVTGSAPYTEVGTVTVWVCVTDDDLGTGCDALDVTIEPYPVAIDVRPGSDPNSINLGASGVIPVAILGGAELDPCPDVDPLSLAFSGASVGVRGRQENTLCHCDDVNGDGHGDLVCQFENELDAQVGDTVGTLVGRTYDGRVIGGQDAIRIVPDPS